MHKFVAPLGMAFCLLCPQAFAGPDLTGFTLDFVDEFDGAELDPAKWNTSPIWGPFVTTNNEEQYYVDYLNADQGFAWSPFSLSGGKLTISAQPVADENIPAAPAQPPKTDSLWSANPEYNYNDKYDPATRKYLSGLITSLGSFNFTYGYAEVKAKVPAGRGLWPAFWQLTTKYVEDVPEIDVMEALGQFPNEVYHSLHYFDTSGEWQLISSPTFETEGPDFTRDYHTYGVMWGPKELTWYVDGVAVKTVDDTGDLLIPKQAMYLIANLAVGGNWPGSPDASTVFPAEYSIDYIKVYRKDMPTPVTPAVLASDYQLMFSDEFDGNQLDYSKWKTSHLWGPYLRINNEEQMYMDTLGRHQTEAANPFTVSEGTLKITANEILQADLPVQEDATDSVWTDEYPTHTYNPDYNTAGGWNPGYTSGLISSYDSFKFVSGYAEMSAKLPSGNGLWPAFWLLNGYYVGPQPEIDIVELQGEMPNTIHQSYHYYDTTGTIVSQPDSTTSPTVDYSQDFHTYAVEWDSEYIKWYIDGTVTRELASENISKQLMYVIANLAVGGTFVGPVESTFPTSLEIDYIRVYQGKNTNQVPLPEVEPLFINQNEWNMVSIPATLEAAEYTVENVFADDLTGVYGTDWVLFEYDSLNRVYFDPGLQGSLQRGQGYWLIQLNQPTVTIDMPASTVVAFSNSITGCATVKCIAHPLQTTGNVREWQMAGNSFDSNVSAGNVRVVTDSGVCQSGCTLAEAAQADLVHDSVFAFRGGPAYDVKQDQDTIESWTGFWLATLPSAHGLNTRLLFSQ